MTEFGHWERGIREGENFERPKWYRVLAIRYIFFNLFVFK